MRWQSHGSVAEDLLRIRDGKDPLRTPFQVLDGPSAVTFEHELRHLFPPLPPTVEDLSREFVTQDRVREVLGLGPMRAKPMTREEALELFPEVQR